MEKEYYRLVSLNVKSGTDAVPTAELAMAVGNKKQQVTAEGSGVVDAAFKAIELLVESHGELLLYSVNSITTGTDSQGEVTVRLSLSGRIVNGLGIDTDIVIASAKAYISALNKLHRKMEVEHPQHSGI